MHHDTLRTSSGRSVPPRRLARSWRRAAQGVFVAALASACAAGFVSTSPTGPDARAVPAGAVRDSAPSSPLTLASRPNSRYHDFGKLESRRRHPQWPLHVMRVREAWSSFPSRGAGVIVATIDSGVGPGRELDGQLVDAADLVTGRPSRVDDVDHGTAVASLIAARADGHGIVGVAPTARVMPVRIFDGYSAPRTRLIRAIRWVADHHADILNLSLTEHPASDLRAAINYALLKGVIIVAGSGNDGTSTVGRTAPTYPAAYPDVIAVGAVRRDLSRAGFSNAGGFVDVVAPGKHVLAADPGDTLSWYDGTSFAAPHVSGVIALMLSEEPRLTAASVTRILRKTAIDLGPRGRDPEYGWGLVDARAAVEAAAGARRPTRPGR